MKFTGDERRILDDNRSGSSEILRAVVTYARRILSRRSESRAEAVRLKAFCRAVGRTFPAMTMVVVGLERLEGIIDGHLSDRGSRRDAVAAIDGLAAVIDGACDRVIKNARFLFRRKITVSTFSNSGLVKKVLAHYCRKIRKVYLSEARPAGEGKELARYLAGRGLAVVYGPDALLPSLVTQADLLVLGADSVGGKTFVNKTGSGMLLAAAREAGVTRAVVFESLKAVAEDTSRSTDTSGPVTELWAGRRPSGVEVLNRYFESIPNRLVDHFISDSGADSPAELARRIKTISR